MRRILVETARRKRRVKHGGELQRVPLAEQVAASPDGDLVALDNALSLLAAEDSLAARVTELRYFAGLGHEDVAATLHITVYQARQKWKYARAWLRDALGNGR
jgi:DNA-directed RNA polymerase specialized sigma24 family protein